MVKKMIRVFLLVGFMGTLTACTGMNGGRADSARSSYDLTLLAIPRTEQTVQIAFDIGLKGYPVILVSYEEVDGKTQLHAWDGSAWVRVTVDAYKSGTFFSKAPTRAVLVGADGKDAPSELIPSSTWCQQIIRTDSDEARSLLNFLGTGFEFTYPHWQWFAERYEFKVSEINPRYLNDKWYYHNLGEYYNRKVKGIDYDTPVEPEFEPVVEDLTLGEPMGDPMDEDPAIVELELDKQVEIIENPLESEEIPAAEEVVEETVEDDASMME
jgi:hypothetical protein